MCGRYSLIRTGVDIEEDFDIILDDSEVSFKYNIAPGQEILAVTKDGQRRARMFKWGFISANNEDVSGGSKPINARGETVADKWLFKSVFRERRCLIPADGFYEWRKENKVRVPYRIRLRSGDLFAFAGVWDSWISPKKSIVETCCIITTAANHIVEPIHSRMPVILTKDAAKIWLNTSSSTTELRELLIPFDSSEMEAYRVNDTVNNWRNDSPDNIVPANSG